MSSNILWDKEVLMNMDPFMLVSALNTKLRNEFESLPALCERFDLNQSDLMSKVGKFGYEYIGEINQFRINY
jgi:hypothetical protein